MTISGRPSDGLKLPILAAAVEKGTRHLWWADNVQYLAEEDDVRADHLPRDDTAFERDDDAVDDRQAAGTRYTCAAGKIVRPDAFRASGEGVGDLLLRHAQ